MLFKAFRGSIALTVIGLALAFWYAGTTGLAIAAILIVLEISLSFDNAVVNATILRKMSLFWQRLFLTVGILIAVVGMRMVFPLLIVGVTANLNPAEAIRLALEKGDPHTPGTYGYLMADAHPSIAAFGGMFLLMLFLSFIFEERDVHWLAWLERPLARVGRLEQLPVVVSLVALAIAGYGFAAEDKIGTVLLSGILGVVAYVSVNSLGKLFAQDFGERNSGEAGQRGANAQLAAQTGKAAFFSFLYLELIDASFSFDGVIGAFALTSDPIIIAIGLGIGALFVRSMTVYLVRQGTLQQYVFLEHGAHWAIGALAVLLLVSIKTEVPELITGLIGVGFILAAFATSVVRNRHLTGGQSDGDQTEGSELTSVSEQR
ncbi:DUF475 domain-containing protein [Melissospora conviva]|uniref:DUF475 domain-containing protein n=1 Tax=Melissospora conviva TaxID=3388432 RepID=UPI003B7D3B38